MPLPVTSPEQEASNALKTLLGTVYATEKIPVVADKLHGSLGEKGAIIGLSPSISKPWSRNQMVLETEILVQFYGKWIKKVDPTQRVDPTTITAFAQRFREGLRTADVKSPGSWYFSLVRITYPDDPTGNKTRFEAVVLSRGSNWASPNT